MSESRRPRGILNTLGTGKLGARGQARPARVGDPNVLSDAAIPNRLSTEAVRPTSTGGRTSDTAPGPLPAIPRPAPGALPGSTQGRRLRIPSLSTLIFLGFVAITAFRIFGEFAEGFSPGSSPGGPSATAPGMIAFGTASDGDCGVTGEAVAFAEGTEVWWSAKLSAMQPAEAAAVVVIRRDDRQIERQDVPADEALGDWDVLCSTEPIAQHIGGTYRVEVWDAQVKLLLAVGEYRLST